MDGNATSGAQGSDGRGDRGRVGNRGRGKVEPRNGRLGVMGHPTGEDARNVVVLVGVGRVGASRGARIGGLGSKVLVGERPVVHWQSWEEVRKKQNQTTKSKLKLFKRLTHSRLLGGGDAREETVRLDLVRLRDGRDDVLVRSETEEDGPGLVDRRRVAFLNDLDDEGAKFD